MAHPEGLEPPILGSKDRTYDLIAPMLDGNPQYRTMPRWLKNRVSLKYLILSPEMAGYRCQPPDFVVECDASVTGGVIENWLASMDIFPRAAFRYQDNDIDGMAIRR